MKELLKITKNSDLVYAKVFKLYNKKEIIEFAKLFKVRFKKNKLNSKKIFFGKKCVDLGCGNGRGSLFMYENGAKSVTAVDISKINLNKTTKVLSDFGYKIKTIHAPLEKLPFNDETFDFVWCNGVIHHTQEPDKSLSELIRILKIKGQSFIYVYGSGGIYWWFIDKIRTYLKKIEIKDLMQYLVKLNYSKIFIGEYLDDWKVLHLRKYTNKNFLSSLKNLEIIKIKKLNRGLTYDTSERLYKGDNNILFGEGDLRYLITKDKKIKKNKKKFLANSSKHISTRLIEAIYKGLLNKLFYLKYSNLTKVTICAKIQNKLRNLMNKKGRFDHKEFTSYLNKMFTHLTQ